jgi:hypothetical protein
LTIDSAEVNSAAAAEHQHDHGSLTEHIGDQKSDADRNELHRKAESWINAQLPNSRIPKAAPKLAPPRTPRIPGETSGLRNTA